MLTNCFKAKNKDSIVFILLTIGAISTIAIYVFFAFKIYYMFDDFQLLIEATKYNIKSLLLPIGTHWRPLMRLHFLIISYFSFYDYIVNNFISLVIYIVSLLSFFILIREIYGRKVALISTLMLTIISSYNEAILWISANGMLYNFLFFNLSFFFYIKKRKYLSSVFLFLAFFSYETWLLFIPAVIFYKIWRREKFKEYLKDFVLILSLFLLILQFLLNKLFYIDITSYGTIKSVGEIPYRVMIYIIRSLSPFNVPSYLVIIILFFLTSLFLIYYVIKSGFDFKITFPVVLYFGAAVIFFLSAKIGSRFFLFPSAALSIFVSIVIMEAIKKGRVFVNVVVYSFLIYLIIISSFVLFIDGNDYRGVSEVYEKLIMQGWKKVFACSEKEKILLKNRIYDRLLIKYFQERIVNKRKLIYFRKNSIGGFIYPNDYVDFILAKKGFISKKIECKGIKKVIEIGRESRVYSVYCFKIVKIK